MTKKIGLVLVIVIVGIIIANLIAQLFDATKSSDRLSQAAEELYKLEVKNKELKKRLQQVRSSEFIEEQARNKLGLGKKGETVVIIPEEKIQQVLGESRKNLEEKLPNWLGWWKVFFR
ncbi:septum formation initiator family protein [Candidatus Daviesbacteria bacterium]|nr:septum formation initiator family protein [Candidatus Daviesbacteria bacterium]